MRRGFRSEGHDACDARDTRDLTSTIEQLSIKRDMPLAYDTTTENANPTSVNTTVNISENLSPLNKSGRGRGRGRALASV
jgi:hypothetical protein